MVASKVIYADIDAWFANTLGGAGNGKGDRMGVGYGVDSGAGDGSWIWQNRLAVRFPRPSEMAGIPSADAITRFDVSLRVSNANFGIGSAVKFYLERGTSTLTENSESRRGYVTGAGPGTGRWPGPSRDTTDRGQYIGTPSTNDWIKVSLLNIAKWWWAHPEVTALVLVGVASDGSGGYAESTAARRCVFYTSQSASAPYAELDWNDIRAPNIPTDLTPAAGTAIGSVNGVEAYVSARYTHPDGLPMSAYQAQWYPASATDDIPGTPTRDYTFSFALPNNGIKTNAFGGLPARTAGKWRMRFYAGPWGSGAWGPWSLLQTNTTAYKPSAVNLAIEPGTLTPKLYASIQSQDPADYITAVEEYVYQDPAVGSTITKLASGKQAIGGTPTRSEYVYNGSALVYGTQYRRRMILYNRDDIPSDLTPNELFTPREATGPVIKLGSSAGPVANLSTKIDDLTETFNLSDPSAANIDQARLRIWNEAGTTLLYDSGTLSFGTAANKDITLPAAIFSWGQNPKVDGAVRVTGNANLGPYCEKIPLHVNATPGSPYPISLSGGTLTVQRNDGVWVTTDPTPDALIPFRDTDVDFGYTEAPTRQEVEVRTMADAHFAASPYIDSSSPVETFTLPALTVETEYKTRARYDDSAAARSDWSDYAFVKYSAAPTLSSVTPANHATVTDPTPTIAWAFASSGGKAQAAYQWVGKVGDSIVYDSGLVAGTAASLTVPPFLLPTGQTIIWTLTVYDTDGLYATISRDFTTSFSVPAALTGLTLTPDLDTDALLVSCDASALATNEFYAYKFYAKSAGGQFRLVATVTDQDAPSILYRAAAHNLETIVRVTQTNGFAESDPIEASEVLGATERGDAWIPGYWLITPDVVTELKYSKHGPGDTQSILEAFTPPMRRDKVILSWGTTGYEGSIALFTNDRDLVLLLRGYKEQAVVAIFKTWYGAVRYVRLTSTPDTDLRAAYIDSSLAYIEVDAASVSF